MTLHNLPTYSGVGKLRSARLFYNATGFEVGLCTCYIERVKFKKASGRLLIPVLCSGSFSVAIKEKKIAPMCDEYDCIKDMSVTV